MFLFKIKVIYLACSALEKSFLSQKFEKQWIILIEWQGNNMKKFNSKNFYNKFYEYQIKYIFQYDIYIIYFI